MSPAFSIYRSLRNYLRSVGGASAVIFAVAAVPAMSIAGLAVDSTRAYLVKSHLSNALDSAALAGAKTLNGTSAEIQADIQMYLDANFPSGFMGADIHAPQVEVTPDGNQIRITASADVDTTFMRVAGITDIGVGAFVEVTRDVRGMELVLVMDNTGSMRSGGKIGTMKDAATELIEILYGERETVDNFWVGLVPYTATVNVGPNRQAWLANYDPVNYALNGAYDVNVVSWKGCVEARAAPLDQTDDPASVAQWPVFYWPSTEPIYDDDGDNSWEFDEFDESAATNTSGNNGTGPNVGCPPPITPLTAAKTTVLDAIDEMAAWHRGGTMGNLGLVWGWRVLSPQWQGLWGGTTPNTLPLSYGTPSMDKVIVMLTDGENQWYDWPGGLPNSPSADYTAYRRPTDNLLGTTSNSVAKGIINDRMLAACQAMKDQGVIIYTITFKVGNKQDLKTLYETCASSPSKYYDSPNSSDLSDIFHAIGDDLAALRLSQ